MQGLHLMGDLFGCGCDPSLLTDLSTLETACMKLTLESGLTAVDQKFFQFPQWQGQPGGITGTILLAESHLCIHTWPERQGVTLDVYVCNFTQDNSIKAKKLFDDLVSVFNPHKLQINTVDRASLTD